MYKERARSPRPRRGTLASRDQLASGFHPQPDAADARLVIARKVDCPD
jgi:hypothetical protein